MPFMSDDYVYLVCSYSLNFSCLLDYNVILVIKMSLGFFSDCLTSYSDSAVVHTHLPGASEVVAIWHYTNLCLM